MNMRTGLSCAFLALVLAVSTLCLAAPEPTERDQQNKPPSPLCNVTFPNGSQPPDKDWGGKGSPDYEKTAAAASYGNGKLWTVLPPNGELQVTRDGQGRLSEKWLWYRAVRGHLSVEGRRLDGSEHFETGPLEEIVVGRDTGLLVQGLEFPVEGCWEITGSAGGTELTFVVEVHASFPVEYDPGRPIILIGAVTKIAVFSPHSWIYMDTRVSYGLVANWAIEVAPPQTPIQLGFTKDTVPEGTIIRVNGFPAKDGSLKIYGREITFPDGPPRRRQ